MYYIYILGSNWGVLYTGLTNDLERRMFEHKTKQMKGFTQKYNVTRLLYVEQFEDIHEAIFRERQNKELDAQETRCSDTKLES